MSKGWESKSVEEQQAAAAGDDRSKAVEQDLAAKRSEAEKKRKIQALEMQRERILSERTSSPHRRNALELALGEIERLLQELGWALKL